MQLSVIHRAFADDVFVKNNESVDLCVFRLHFNVGRRGAVPNWRTIFFMRWVGSFLRIGGVNKHKSPKCTGTTSENSRGEGT